MSNSLTELGFTKMSRPRVLKLVVLGLLLVSAAEFVVRGPARYLQARSEWNDFSQNYTASKLWLRGKSPSNPKNFVALWKEQTYIGLDVSDIRTHLAPPLGGLVAMAPVAALPWKIAKVIWLSVLLLSFAATVWVFIGRLEESWREKVIFVAACLAFAPFHTGIASGNTSILVVGFCAVAIAAALESHDAIAGILFGFACSLKPQLGAFLVLYYLIQRRWRLFVAALGSTIALNVIAVFYLSVRGTTWLQDYLSNARGFVTSNSIDSFASDNPARFALLNLQVPFFSLTHQVNSANFWAFVVTGVLVSTWTLFVFKTKEKHEFVALAAISTISLLPVYHRFYDAAILVIPLCWCLVELTRSSKPLALCGLFLLSPFFFPGTALLGRLASHDGLHPSLTNSWIWESVVMPHETWALLLLSAILLYAVKETRVCSAKS